MTSFVYATETAAQRALALPEILSIIFEQRISKDGLVASHQSDLFRWALVNSRWFSEAIPALWARSQFPLDLAMAKTTPERRQFYANYVMWTRVLHLSNSEKDPFVEDGPLHGLVFPRLTRIFASIYTSKDNFCTVSTRGASWSRIMCFERCEATNETTSNMDSVFRVISSLMPGIRHMVLGYDSSVSHLEGMIEASEDDWITAPPNLHWFVREEPRTEEETEIDDNEDNEDSAQDITDQTAEPSSTLQASLHPTYDNLVVSNLG